MPRVNYTEGDWFAVPVRTGGFCVGVIARANSKAALLGYFFGPRRPSIPNLADLVSLSPAAALLVGKFGHLALVQGSWPNIGRLEHWDRLRWPMPVFIRHEELTGRTFRVYYDSDDPARLVREEVVPRGELVWGPKDGLMGAGFVEERLARLLESPPSS